MASFSNSGCCVKLQLQNVDDTILIFTAPPNVKLNMQGLFLAKSFNKSVRVIKIRFVPDKTLAMNARLYARTKQKIYDKMCNIYIILSRTYKTL